MGVFLVVCNLDTYKAKIRWTKHVCNYRFYSLVMAPRRDVMFIAKKYTFVLLRVFRYSQRMTRFRSKIRALLDLFNIQAFFSALQINVIILLQYIDVKSVNMSETSG